MLKKEVKELEVDKAVLKRIEMICRFANVKPHILKIKNNNYSIFEECDIFLLMSIIKR